MSFPQYRFFILLGLVFTTACLQAQMPVGINFMLEPHQRSFANPAVQQDVRVQLLGLGINGQAAISRLRLGDLLIEDPTNDSLYVDLTQLASNPRDRFLRGEGHVDILGAVVNVKGIQVGLTFGLRNYFQGQIPADLVGLLVNGNGAYLDQTVELGPRVSMMSYSETALSGSYKIKNLQVGARFKFLNGIFNMSTNPHSATLYTDPEFYQLTFETDYLVQLGGIFPTDTATLFGSNNNPNEPTFDPADVRPFTRSQGFALDLGATYQLNEDLELGASILNLGSINWKENARQFTSNGSFTFEGLDPDEDPDNPLLERLLNFELDALADTIGQTFNFEETETQFSTPLPSNINLTANYTGIPLLQLGGMYGMEFWQNRTSATIGLYAGLKVNRVYSLGLSYAYQSQFANRIGIHSHLNAGPFQFYVSADNVFGLIAPDLSQSASIRFGGNLLIGKGWK